MLWSDQAFRIYMGDAGFVTPVDATADDVTSFDVMDERAETRATDPCTDDEPRRESWLKRAGTSLTDTQVYRTARG